MKKILLVVALMFVSTFSLNFVQADSYFIIPEQESSEANDATWDWTSWATAEDQEAKAEEQRKELKEIVNEVGDEWWKVWEKYNKQSDELEIGQQMATWIMNWDTIINYIKYLWNFLWEVWLVIAAAMLIYAWYMYALSVFKWDMSSKWKTAITSAITWVLIIVFAYFIIKVLIQAFW